MENLNEEIDKILNELENEFQNSQGLILNEDDLKCHLFRKLYSLFDHQLNTMDASIFASPLHTEIKFFDENRKLSLRPDITILNTEDLSILHSLDYKIDKIGAKFKNTTHKQFEFGGNSIIFELKFCRNRNGINKQNIKTYLKDIEKIRRLQTLVNTRSNGQNKLIGYFVVFNKTNKKVAHFNEIFSLQTDSLKMIYKTGMVNFPEQNKYLFRLKGE